MSGLFLSKRRSLRKHPQREALGLRTIDHCSVLCTLPLSLHTLTLETQAIVPGPSGSWFITCIRRLVPLTFPAVWSCLTPQWAPTCYFHQQSPSSCSQRDYFTQQCQVLSLSVAVFGSAGKWWQDKLNIIVDWISRSINRAVLREKPENMFQRLDRDRWLSSAWPVSWGHTAPGQASVEA